ncbi:hypothetical protein PS15p_210921 [Mucor circinelloides]
MIPVCDNPNQAQEADRRRQEENDWAYFDRDRICAKIKTKFSNNNKAYKERSEAHQARKQAERRKQRRTKANTTIAQLEKLFTQQFQEFKKNDRIIDFLNENTLVRSSLTEKWGSASLFALSLEEFHSDNESDSEDANKPWLTYLPSCRLNNQKLKDFYDDLTQAIKEKKKADAERLGAKPIKTHPLTDDYSRPASTPLSYEGKRCLNKSQLLEEDYTF